MWWKQAEFLQAVLAHYRPQGRLQYLALDAAQLHGAGAYWMQLAKMPLIAWHLLPEQLLLRQSVKVQGQVLFHEPAMLRR